MKLDATIKRIMLLLIACQGAFALQSPTITGLVALSDTSAWLTWHSNDPATTGFYIHRVDPFMSSSRIIDTLPAADTEYIAIVSPAETYGFGVAAFSATEVSATTPYSIITMPGIMRIFSPPGLSSLWDTAASAVYLKIIDNSTTEVGYEVFRTENFGAFSELTAFKSDTPACKDTLLFTDNTAKIGAWYTYRVTVYNSSNKDSSEATVFAYPKKPARTTTRILLGSKISDYPVRFGLWALKQGDTICVQQDAIPFDSCTLIDVRDKERPLFAGRIKNSVPLHLQEPQSYSSLENLLFYRNRGRMVQYRFLNGAVDSICSVPQYNLHSQPPATSVGQVVGTVNNNVLVIRYADDKYFHYDSHFFSQQKIVPLGTFQQGGFGLCNEVSFLFFRAGIAYDFWATGFQNGATCDMSHLVQQYYLSYDFSFDPRAPVETVYQYAPDTVLRECNGSLTSDAGIKKSKAIFVDSAKSLVYLMNDTVLSVYSFFFATVFSKQLPKPSPLNSRLNIRYNSIGRRLVIENAGTLNAASTKIKLFSLNGALLHAQEIGPWNIVPVPDGIRGIILVRVDAANKRMERKMIIVK